MTEYGHSPKWTALQITLSSYSSGNMILKLFIHWFLDLTALIYFTDIKMNPLLILSLLYMISSFSFQFWSWIILTILTHHSGTTILSFCWQMHLWAVIYCITISEVVSQKRYTHPSVLSVHLVEFLFCFTPSKNVYIFHRENNGRFEEKDYRYISLALTAEIHVTFSIVWYKHFGRPKAQGTDLSCWHIFSITEGTP